MNKKKELPGFWPDDFAYREFFEYLSRTPPLYITKIVCFMILIYRIDLFLDSREDNDRKSNGKGWWHPAPTNNGSLDWYFYYNRKYYRRWNICLACCGTPECRITSWCNFGLGILWFTLYDWCILLCGIGLDHTHIGRGLYLCNENLWSTLGFFETLDSDFRQVILYIAYKCFFII